MTSGRDAALEGAMVLLAGTGLRVSMLWDDSCCVRYEEDQRDGPPSMRTCGRPGTRRWLVLAGGPAWRARLKAHCPVHANLDPAAGLRDPEVVELTEDELTVLRVMSS